MHDPIRCLGDRVPPVAIEHPHASCSPELTPRFTVAE
jgi:hypothetical protein